MLFAPIALGWLPSMLRLRFVPHPSLANAALAALVAYYVIAIQVAKRLSGHKLYFPRPGSREFLNMLVALPLGLLLFGVFALQTFLILVPVMVTATGGQPAEREFVIASSRHLSLCGHQHDLVDVATQQPASYCSANRRTSPGWREGQHVRLRGKASALGFLPE